MESERQKHNKKMLFILKVRQREVCSQLMCSLHLASALGLLCNMIVLGATMQCAFISSYYTVPVKNRVVFGIFVRIDLSAGDAVDFALPVFHFDGAADGTGWAQHSVAFQHVFTHLFGNLIRSLSPGVDNFQLSVCWRLPFVSRVKILVHVHLLNGK